MAGESRNGVLSEVAGANFQIHTMHPIELADFLNGWGPEGLWDNTGFDAGFKEWELYLHWLVANRQNHVLWVLLWAEDWDLPRAMMFSPPDPDCRCGACLWFAGRRHVPLRFCNILSLLREQGELSDELAEIGADRRSWVLVLTFWPLSPAHQNSPIRGSPDARLDGPDGWPSR